MSDNSEADINHIIQMSLKGDKKYKEILLNCLKPLLYKNIYLYCNLNVSMTEDLLQEGYCEVLEALNTYNENKDVHFLAFIKWKIKYFYMNYYKTCVKYYQNNLLSDEVCDTGTKNIEETMIKNEEIYTLMKCVDKLEPDEKQIIYSYYFYEDSLCHVAEKLNKSYASTAGRKFRVLKKLKICMHDN